MKNLKLLKSLKNENSLKFLGGGISRMNQHANSITHATERQVRPVKERKSVIVPPPTEENDSADDSAEKRSPRRFGGRVRGSPWSPWSQRVFPLRHSRPRLQATTCGERTGVWSNQTKTRTDLWTWGILFRFQSEVYHMAKIPKCSC